MSRGLRGFLVYKLSIALALVLGIGLWERGARLLIQPGQGLPFLLIAGVIVGILLVILRARSRCVVVVAANLVEIHRRSRPAVRIAMCDIVSATHQHLHKRLVIQTRSGEQRVTVWELSPFDLSVADACARAIRERVASAERPSSHGEQATTRTASED